MDEDDKIRRNLVVFSAAMLGIAIFRVDVHRLAVDSLKVQGFNTVTAWTVAGFVLAYLVVRYHFSAEARKLKAQIEQHTDRERWARIAPYVQDQVKEAFRSGSRSAAVGSEVDSFIPQVVLRAGTEASSDTVRTFPLNVALDRAPDSLWTGNAGMNVLLPGSGNSVQHNVHYVVPRWKRRRIATATFVLSWVWSDTAINLVFPYAFAVVAEVVVLWKIAAAVWL